MVEPSKEISIAYTQKSHKSLSSAKILYKAGNIDDSVAMAYYAMYHALLSLLFLIGIKCENHSAAIIMLKSIFGIDSSAISSAKAERVDKQYYVDFSVSRGEVGEAIRSAEDFIADITDFTQKINNPDVARYQSIAEELIKG
ncbi:HEPN domain-containing protein [Candidatus Woesearchaeota archaeon]|nr:HEPN domain-containing protein [Candidatus Woesearchaeota archaeon]